MENFEKDLKKCKNYENIISDIITMLDKKGIEYERLSKNELVVNKTTKKEVSKLIDSFNIPSSIKYLLLEIKEFKKNTYIRKKVK